MGLEATPYTIPLGIAAAIAAAMFALAATQRGRTGAYTMMGLFGAMLLYAVGYAFQLASTTLPEMLFWHAVRYAGPALVTLAFLIFALQYTDRESLVTRRNVALLSVIPVLTLVLVWTDVYGVHDLVLGAVSTETAGGIERLVLADGPWYVVHSVYSTGLTVAGIGLFVKHWWSTEGADSKRSRIFAVAGIIPISGTLVYAAGLTAIDWGPITYVVTGLMLIIAIFYY